MATSKPHSTISYNTEPFLKSKLDSWLKAHYIQAYQYIRHKGEDGDKDHIHLRIEPNKALDLMDLTEDLKEPVHGSDKPLGVRPWRPSKEEDWFLYSVHDPKYLKIKYGDGSNKGEKLPYKDEDIVVSENYDLEVAMIRARAMLEHTAPSIIKAIREGESPVKLAELGNNPALINQTLNLFGHGEINKIKSDLLDAQKKLHIALLKNKIYEDFLLSQGYVLGEDSKGLPTIDLNPFLEILNN